MENWRECSLGDVVTFQRGFDITSKDLVHGDIPIVSSSGIREYHNEFKVESPGVVIGRKGTLGTVHYLNTRYWPHDTTLWVKNFHGNEPLFIYYFLRTLKLEDYDVGTSNPTLNRNHIHLLKVSVPIPSIQIEIAKILKSLDDKIDLLHRQNKTLEAMAETLFRQWFVEEAEESWEETRLENHVEVLRGLSYKGSGLSEAGYGIPMHNLNSVLEGGGYKFEGIKFYNGIYKERHVVRPGDLIVANTEQGHEHRLIGFPAIVPERFGEYGIFSQHIYKLTLLPQSTLSLEFIYHTLLSSEVREQVVGATNGSTVNMLAIDGLQRPKFREPTKEKVKEFTLIVNNFWKKKEVNFIQIETLEKLRDNLLPKLMAGHLAVNS